MTKEQIAVFEDLLKDPNFKGKKSLNHLLWLNTAPQKGKVGECFTCRADGRTKIYGNRVRLFNGKIKEISAFITGECWYYTLEVVFICGEKIYTTDMHISEDELVCKCGNNVTRFETAFDGFNESVDV